MLNVGYCMSQSKQKRLGWPKFIDYCKENHSIILHELDITQPIKLEVKLDAILQKITDELFKEDELSKKKLSNFLNYVNENPETVVIGDIEKLKVFRSRLEINETIKPKVEEIENAFVPPSIVASSCTEAEELISKDEFVNYPVICKPVSAGGSSKTHEIYIIGNKEGLNELNYFPYLITPYYSHFQTIYKIFINGDSYVSVPRYSLRNIDSNELDGFKTAKLGKGIQIPENIKPNKEIPLQENLKSKQLNAICEKLKTSLGVEILGVDVIRCEKDQRLSVIDVNYFPGFIGVQSFYRDLASHLKKKIQNKNLSKTIKN
ncbi:inositol-tetrakisphosphate 1-kinase [Anaeramoeba flamelloides]|uniref:Inositol-tetrakisphosphate 1-kinase n=1 Tax=Anaeramoeba flamelloides TaxID=1746091 RepID=A0AAV7YEX5_9EUKA|nr:inositol-tetrakisphosphate 1-kinase [Anaeramoeba flamelloides]KAJ6242643.1 inositol-tetrakisphosphate 1-kinase [Anaeramoeba flamelloides]